MTHQACGDGGRVGDGAARKRLLTRGQQLDRSTWLSKCFGLSTAARPCAHLRAVRSFLVDPWPKDHAKRRPFCDSRGTFRRTMRPKMTFVCGKVGFRDEAAILTAFGDKFQALPPGLKQDCTTCSAAGCTVANLWYNPG